MCEEVYGGVWRIDDAYTCLEQLTTSAQARVEWSKETAMDGVTIVGCVCVCVRARARVCVCLCVCHAYVLAYWLVRKSKPFPALLAARVCVCAGTVLSKRRQGIRSLCRDLATVTVLVRKHFLMCPHTHSTHHM